MQLNRQTKAAEQIKSAGTNNLRAKQAENFLELL